MLAKKGQNENLIETCCRYNLARLGHGQSGQEAEPQREGVFTKHLTDAQRCFDQRKLGSCRLALDRAEQELFRVVIDKVSPAFPELPEWQARKITCKEQSFGGGTEVAREYVRGDMKLKMAFCVETMGEQMAFFPVNPIIFNRNLSAAEKTKALQKSGFAQVGNYVGTQISANGKQTILTKLDFGVVLKLETRGIPEADEDELLDKFDIGVAAQVCKEAQLHLIDARSNRVLSKK